MQYSKVVKIKNTLSELDTLNSILEGIWEENNIPMNLLFNVNLSLEELLTNIINYGYEDKKEHFIELDFQINNSTLSIKVADDAKPFNPLLLPEPDINASIEERRIGGLGIHFMKKLMDNIDYQWDNGKNILTMTKSIS